MPSNGCRTACLGDMIGGSRGFDGAMGQRWGIAYGVIPCAMLAEASYPCELARSTTVATPPRPDTHRTQTRARPVPDPCQTPRPVPDTQNRDPSPGPAGRSLRPGLRPSRGQQASTYIRMHIRMGWTIQHRARGGSICSHLLCCLVRRSCVADRPASVLLHLRKRQPTCFEVGSLILLILLRATSGCHARHKLSGPDCPVRDACNFPSIDLDTWSVSSCDETRCRTERITLRTTHCQINTYLTCLL
ncbi:hypothetical protein F4808DRAFT_428949 [Astrocystis sublimbata]|nr:hypothetical protein F4808DRAFT_428949 [Astrocystis sublimbata]